MQGGLEIADPDAHNRQLMEIGVIAMHTLRAVLDELGIDRRDLRTGTDVVNAVKAKVTELKERTT